MLTIALMGLALFQAVTPAQISNQEAAAGAIRRSLDAKLVDYPSARFRDVYVSRNPAAEAERGGAGPGYLCGYVNSKNAMGGYVGWKRFMASADSVWIEGDSVAAIVLDAACGPGSANDGVDRSSWLVHR